MAFALGVVLCFLLAMGSFEVFGPFGGMLAFFLALSALLLALKGLAKWVG